MATSDKLIQVQDLKKYYNGDQIKALDGVSVDINRGDVMVIIGPSGSGKSTFLRSLNLLEVPTSGSIIFEGTDITKKKGPDGKKLNIDLHRQKMGMVFQHFNLFPHKTILQNMTLAPIKVKGVPQAVKNILPALGNEFIMIVKDTSLASTFFIGDLMTQCLLIKGTTYLTMEPLIMVAVVYFVLTFVLSKLLAVFERRLRRGDIR